MSNKTFSKATYREALLDPRWQKMRLKVYERDGFQCRICGSLDKTLHAHHAYYAKSSEGPWDYDESAIITLCSSCHKKEGEELACARESLFASLCQVGFQTASDLNQLSEALCSKWPLTEYEKRLLAHGIFAMLESRAVHSFGADPLFADGELWSLLKSWWPES